MLRRAGASTAKNALRGSDWTWSGASAGLRGAQSSLLGQPLRKYMVRARPRQSPAAPAASVTLGGPGPGAHLPHRHRPSRRRRQRQLGASARGPGRAGPTRCCATQSRTLTGRGWGRRAPVGPRREEPRPARPARCSRQHAARRGEAPEAPPGSLRPPRVGTQASGLDVDCSVRLAGDLDRGAGDRNEATGSVSDGRSGRAHLHFPWIGATSRAERGGPSGARVT